MSACRDKLPQCTGWVDDGYGQMDITLANLNEVLGRKDTRWVAGKGDVTMGASCCVKTKLLVNLPGACNEHEKFLACPTGKFTDSEWLAFVDDIRRNGVKSEVLIIKEKDGHVHVWEGNHRIKAAYEAGVDEIPTEFKYMGNSQRKGLISAHRKTLEAE